MAYSESDTRSKLNDEKDLRAIWSDPANRKDLLNKLREMNIDKSS